MSEVIRINDELVINGIKYVRKDSIVNNEIIKNNDGLNYVIVRTQSAGVFAGYLKREKGEKEGIIYNARRLWMWEGAASLSQLAHEGTSKPNKCKFPCEVPEVIVTEIIEILRVSNKAKLSIESVPIWKE
jgi:hypothetical protein